MTNIIQAPKDAIYLSDFMTTLPHGVLDKVITGCGGTTIAIENDVPYVILVPNIALVESKCKRYPHLIPFTSKVDQDKKDYRTFNLIGTKTVTCADGKTKTLKDVPKIIGTYDALGEIVEFLSNRINDFSLLVDEMHMLTTDAKFRKDAILPIMYNFDKFNHYTFMTATITHRHNLNPIIKKLDQHKIDWQKSTSLYVRIDQCENLNNRIIDIINDDIKYSKSNDNLHFYYNKTHNGIDYIINHLLSIGISKKDIRVVVGNNTELKYDDTYLTDNVCKYNFYTKSGFQGIDIDDAHGASYICVNPKDSKTLVDFTSTVRQIQGRMRNNKRDITMIISDIDISKFDKCRADLKENYDAIKKDMMNFIKAVNKNKDSIQAKKLHNVLSVYVGQSTKFKEYVSLPTDKEYKAMTASEIIDNTYLHENAYYNDLELEFIDTQYIKLSNGIDKLRRVLVGDLILVEVAKHI